MTRPWPDQLHRMLGVTMSRIGYTILITVFLPLLIFIWASCLIICLYKHIILRSAESRLILMNKSGENYFDKNTLAGWKRIGRVSVLR